MTAITGNAIDLYRLKVLRTGLKLECKGLQKRGQSCFQIIKKEFGLKGNKQSVLVQFENLICKMEV